MSSIRYWVWLSSVSAANPRARFALAEHYGDAEKAFHAPSGELKTIQGLSAFEAEQFERRDLREADRILETIRSNDGSGTVSTMDRPVVCPMLSDAFNTLVMFDNTAFLFETSTGTLRKSYVFGDAILYAGWLDRQEERAEILTGDGTICQYDFSNEPTDVLDEYMSDEFDQTGLRFCLPAEPFLYVTVRREKPGRVLAVESVTDPMVSILTAQEEYPDYVTLSPSGRGVLCFDREDSSLSVRSCDPETGEVIPNKELTTDPTPSKSYAFCSDTMYSEKVIPIIKGCDVLYHESTYSNVDTLKAHLRGHSTSVEAATIALKAEVGRLLLGHYSSQFMSNEDEEILLDEARQIFPNTTLSREQMVVEI